MRGRSDDPRSPEEIQRDIERTRADLGETLEEIERRLSPGNMLDQALDYFRNDPKRASRIGEVIKENPLPAALIGVGAAWLALAASRGPAAERYPPRVEARRRRAPAAYPRGYRAPGAAEPAAAGAGAYAATGAAYTGRGELPTVSRETLMAVSRENLVDWLRDAHAMENQAVEILEKQAARLEHYPELEAKVRQHLQESKRQGERIEECLHRLGTDTSALKTGVGKLTGTAQQLSGLFASDEVMKSGIADYAFEHYEIASYKALIAAAAEAGEPDVRRVCEENLREEQAMADWLSQHLPEVTRQYLVRAAAGQEAKK